MRQFCLSLLVVFGLALCTSASADVVTFVLDSDANGTDIDGAGAGGFLTGTPAVTGGITTTLTTSSVTALEFDGMGMLTGNTVAAETNATASNFGINNPSINNTDFNTATGAGTSESSNINFGESFTFSFDQDVTFNSIDFASIGGNGESADFTINGITTSFLDGAANDTFADPFNGLLITAGTAITVTGGGSQADTNFRIDVIEVHVATVPEPSSALALLSLVGLVACKRRRG